MEHVSKNELRTITITSNQYAANVDVKFADGWELRNKDSFNHNLGLIIKRYLYQSLDSRQRCQQLEVDIDHFIAHQMADRNIYYINPSIFQEIKPVVSPEVTRKEASDKYEKAIEQYASIAEKFRITNYHDVKFISNKLASLYKKYAFWDVRVAYEDNLELFKLLGTYGYGKDYTDEYYNEVTGNWIYIGFKHDYMEEAYD